MDDVHPRVPWPLRFFGPEFRMALALHVRANSLGVHGDPFPGPRDVPARSAFDRKKRFGWSVWHNSQHNPHCANLPRTATVSAANVRAQTFIRMPALRLR